MNDAVRRLPPILFLPVDAALDDVPHVEAPALEIPLGPAAVPQNIDGGDGGGVPVHALNVMPAGFPNTVEVGAGDDLEKIMARLLALPGAPERAELEKRMRFNHPGIDLGALKLGQVLELGEVEKRAPTRIELLRSPIVRREIEAAWKDSFPDDPAKRHEEGGWILMNIATGVVFTHRAVRGANANIDLSNPVLYVDAVIVGTYHTHPHPKEDKYDLGPSRSDEDMDISRGVPGIVRSREGYHAYSWDHRLGLTGKTGFFPGTPERPLD